MNKLLRVIVILLVLILSSSCDVKSLPLKPEQDLKNLLDTLVEKSIDFVESLADKFVNNLTKQIKDLTDKFIRDIEDLFIEVIPESISQISDFLGLTIPEDVGKLSIAISPHTNRVVIDKAFDKAFLDAGAGRVLGKPMDLVHYWDDTHKEILIQFFDGGSEGRSAIIMKQETMVAFALPGDFLISYTAIGGPLAGFPTSNPENWSGTFIWTNWGHGQKQLFKTITNEDFALLRPNNIMNAFILPPFIWKYYERNDLVKKIGYPLSSYPLNVDLWKTNPSIPSETHEILRNWANQTIRMVVFQHGSLWSKNEWNSIEIVEAQSAPIDTSHFLQGVQFELQAHYFPLYDNQIGNACYRETIRLGANIFGRIVPEALITDFGNLLIRGTLEVANLATSSIGAKLALLGTKLLINLVKGQDPTETVIFWFAGRTLDSFFTKIIGDTLSKPTTLVVRSSLEAEYKALSTNRLGATGSVTENAKENEVPNPLTANIVIQYDPLTHMVNGIITSTCARNGYAFSYRANPNNGRIAEPTETWDGKMSIYNLQNNERMP